MMDLDDVIEKLQEAINLGDYVLYKSVVETNLTTLLDAPGDFWREVFREGTREEISFWIDFPDRNLSVYDLVQISFENKDLFGKGINRQNLDIEDLDYVIEYDYLDKLDVYKEGPERIILLNQIAQLKNIQNKRKSQEL